MFTVIEASRGGPILVYNFNLYVEVYFGLLKLRTQNLTISSFSFRSEHRVFWYYSDYAQNALQREWGNFPFANWNGICWGLPLQLVQLIKIHFLPHLESFMWERKFEKNFFKKNPIQPPNGALLIFKLPFPNGSYCNEVCRALWAMKF